MIIILKGPDGRGSQLITGARVGIGQTCARAFAEEADRLVGSGR